MLAKEECLHTIIVKFGIRVVEPVLFSRFAIVGKKSQIYRPRLTGEVRSVEACCLIAGGVASFCCTARAPVMDLSKILVNF